MKKGVHTLKYTNTSIYKMISNARYTDTSVFKSTSDPSYTVSRIVQISSDPSFIQNYFSDSSVHKINSEQLLY